MANAQNINVSPQNAVLAAVDLTTVSACTTRGPTATASMTAGSVNGVLAISVPATDTKISKVSIKGNSTGITTPNVATIIGIWVLDATLAKGVLRKEIAVDAVTPNSTTTISKELDTLYDDFVIPAAASVWITSTVANPLLNVSLHGASM
jgi:hypothetical protein